MQPQFVPTSKKMERNKGPASLPELLWLAIWLLLAISQPFQAQFCWEKLKNCFFFFNFWVGVTPLCRRQHLVVAAHRRML